MELVFWIMITALLLFAASYAAAVFVSDSWGELFFPALYLFGAVFVGTAIVFVILFGLDSLGISVNVDSR